MTEHELALRGSRRSAPHLIQNVNHQKVICRLMGKDIAGPLGFEETKNPDTLRENTHGECSSLKHLEVHE
jgi:type II secretory pathway component PulC